MAEEFDTVTIPELDDLTLALTSYFATSNINGKLGKATVADFVTFIAPYIQGVAASGFVPISGTVLPNSPSGSFSIVGGPTTFTQTTGGNVVTTAPLNIIAKSGATWSLLYAIPLDLTNYYTKSQLDTIIPKSSSEKALPASQAGYYRTDNGAFTANSSYASFKFNLADYPAPLYVTGTIKDAGTALIFYYNSANALISYQFQGTASNVNFTNQLLTIPAGTVSIGFTTLVGGLTPKIMVTSFATDILTKAVADSIYASNATIAANYIPLSLMPTKDNGGIIDFNNIDYSGIATSGGDTSIAYYTNVANRTVKPGTILKKVRIKATGADTARLIAVSIDTTSGTPVPTVTHAYSSFAITTGDNEYTISDSFSMPAGTYIGVRSTNNLICYSNTSGVKSFRVASSLTTAANSPVTIAMNFTTNDVSTDLSTIVTKPMADQIYQPKGAVISDVRIHDIRQVKYVLAPTDKIELYGDSISSTDYPWYKSSMETLTGAVVYNGGFSGFTTSQLAKNAQLQRIFDYAANLNIIMVGGNDSGAINSVGTFGAVTTENTVTETDISIDYNGTTFIQAVDHIMRKMKAQYYNIRARANLTGTETEAEKTAKIDAVLKPYFVFCTPLPQKRINSSDAFSQVANWQRKRDAVVEACNKNNFHCIDLYNLFAVDMSLEPFWPGTTDKVTNNGIYTMDGLHPNKYGYDRIARIVCGQLGII